MYQSELNVTSPSSAAVWCVASVVAETVMFVGFARLQICGSQKLLDQFVESNKLLDSVQKGLADYLETKRLAFAR